MDSKLTQAERDFKMFKAGWTMGWSDGNLGVPNLSTRIFTAERAWALYNQDRAPRSKKSRCQCKHHYDDHDNGGSCLMESSYSGGPCRCVKFWLDKSRNL